MIEKADLKTWKKIQIDKFNMRFTIFQRWIFVKNEFKDDQSFLSPTDSLKLRTAKTIIQNNENQNLSRRHEKRY